jgi:hypothetical protein
MAAAMIVTECCMIVSHAVKLCFRLFFIPMPNHAAIAALATWMLPFFWCEIKGTYSLFGFELTSTCSYSDCDVYSSILAMLKRCVESEGSFQKSSLLAVPIQGL